MATTAAQLTVLPRRLLCLQAAGYGKVVSHVIIGLKTVKGTKQLKLDPTIYDSLQKERVQVSLLIVVCWSVVGVCSPSGAVVHGNLTAIYHTAVLLLELYSKASEDAET